LFTTKVRASQPRIVDDTPSISDISDNTVDASEDTDTELRVLDDNQAANDFLTAFLKS